MKLTNQQKNDILPLLQKMVQGIIDSWEAQREIEVIMDTDFDGMTAAAEAYAVNYDRGNQVTLEDVKMYIEELQEE